MLINSKKLLGYKIGAIIELTSKASLSRAGTKTTNWIYAFRAFCGGSSCWYFDSNSFAIQSLKTVCDPKGLLTSFKTESYLTLRCDDC